MTPQEIADYKTTWLKNAHVVKIHSDLDVQGKDWCRRYLERHQWAFAGYTDMYEHTFYFEFENHANQFKEHFISWVNE